MAQSQDKPKLISRANDKWLYCFDAEKVTRQDETGDSVMWDFKAIFVNKKSRDEIVPAIIRLQYSQNDEFKALRTGDESYKAYVEDARFVGKVLTKEVDVLACTAVELDRIGKVLGIELSGLKVDKQQQILAAL
jgi:uncharacterized protein YuzE